MPSFHLFVDRTGVLSSSFGASFPCAFSAWNQAGMVLEEVGTHFGFVHQGVCRLHSDIGVFELKQGMYFAVPGPGRIEGAGAGFVVTRSDMYAFFQIGGPVEETGRLRYIDGCTDSLLIAPTVMGDPCLNLLHFPPGIEQTAHTHPSFRAGLVYRGRGVCRLADRDVPLEPGSLFIIDAETVHHFATMAESMTVIAFHPDSDFGPAHDDHPMINRTIVDGVSARHLDAIRTLEITS